MPTSRRLISLPGTISAATMKNAAEEKSPGTGTSPASSRSVGETVTSPPSRRIVRARGRQHPLGVVTRPVRLVDGRLPSASSPASSTQDLTWALATGIS